MTDLVIRGALLDGEPTSLEIAGGEIRAVAAGDGGALRPARRTIDASGLHLFPSFRNAHTHAAMTLFRGWGDDMPLMRWLQKRIWPAEGRMTAEDVYDGTRLAILEMIHSGTTHFNDMYWHAPEIARAVQEMGVRAHVGAAFVDLGREEVARRWRRGVEEWLERRGAFGDRVRATVAPHAVYTVSPDNLRWLGSLAASEGLLLHIHLSETAEEVASCVREHGVRPAVLLERLGLVGPTLVAAHGVYLDRDELDLLGNAGATVVTNPAANLKLATGGIFDVPAARAAGVRVVLGTDGAASNNNLDMAEEMKLLALIQKHRALDATVVPAAQALALATREPASLFGPGEGRVEVGQPADLILVAPSAPAAQPGHDIVSDLVYAGNGSWVHTTICDGRVLMHDRRVEVADEAEIVARARAAARRLTA